MILNQVTTVACRELEKPRHNIVLKKIQTFQEIDYSVNGSRTQHHFQFFQPPYFVLYHLLFQASVYMLGSWYKYGYMVCYVEPHMVQRVGSNGQILGDHPIMYACIIHKHVDKKRLNTKTKYTKELTEPISQFFYFLGCRFW